jgi:hypothetical protein
VGATWLAFGLTLALIAVLGLVLGATLNSLLVPSRGFMSDLGTGFKLLVCVAPLTLAFLVVGMMTGNRSYALYPVIAFVLAGRMSSPPFAPLVTLIADVVPAQVGPARYDYPLHLASVFLAYVVVHSVVWPLQLAVRSTEPSQAATRTAAIWIFAVAVIGILAAPLWVAPTAYAMQRRANAVRLPNSATLIAEPSSRTIYGRSGSTMVPIGRYATVRRSFGVRRSVRTACGAGVQWDGLIT